MSTGETIPDDPLEQIRATATGLLLDGEGGSWGSGPEGLTDRHVTYMLEGESIGEGGTFFVVEFQYSGLGLIVSMGQYSDLETVEKDPDPTGSNHILKELGVTPERAKEEDSPLVLVSFFDVDPDFIPGAGEIHAIDTEVSAEELSQLMKVMGHPDLQPLILSDEHDQKYNWTSVYHMQRRIAALHPAFLRVAGDNPAAVQFADWNWLGTAERPGAESSTATTKSERVLPTIVRWLSRRLRGRNI
jgi:hypothetical protein